MANLNSSIKYLDDNGLETLVEIIENNRINDKQDLLDAINDVSGDIGDGTITIKRNNTSIGSFSTNQDTNEEINISVPTSIADLGSGAVTEIQNIIKYGQTDVSTLTEQEKEALEEAQASATGYVKENDLIDTLADYGTSINYNSTTQRVELKNGDTVLSSFDAGDFIKDGMVTNVEVKNVTISGEPVRCLSITFNTDAGIQDSVINIPLSDLFDPGDFTEIQIGGTAPTSSSEIKLFIDETSNDTVEVYSKAQTNTLVDNHIEAALTNKQDTITDQATIGNGYGVCSTASGTAAKEVSITDFVLKKNCMVSVRFQNAINESNPTLNVNSTGAKPIYYKGSILSADVVKSGMSILLHYDGTNFNIIGDLITGSYVWEGTTTPPNGYDIWVDPSNGNNSVLKIKNKTTGNWDGITTIKGDPSTADINLSGSVITVTNNAGQSNSIDLLNAAEETVQIVVTTSVAGVSVSGLVINVYYNGASTPATSVTTDSNGMAVLRVPNGYTYKLVFPSIQGCVEPSPVVHTAAVSQRSVEVEYEEYSISNSEKVTVFVRDFNDNVYTNDSDITITVTSNNVTNTYLTNSTGKASFYIPYGHTYSVTTQTREGKHIRYGEYTQTYKSQSTARVVYFTYYDYEVGIFIVTADGNQYSLADWKELVEAGTKQNSEALYIKIATADLSNNNSTFVIDIDMVREKNYGSTLMWCNQELLFNSIPAYGNSASTVYYYDGLNASKVIYQEGIDRSLQTPAVTKCLGLTRTIRENTENEQVLQGFLGSCGQWNALWTNLTEIDEILIYTRPEGSYTMSSQTMAKWATAQNYANFSYSWTTVPDGNSRKDVKNTVVPFFAF